MGEGGPERVDGRAAGARADVEQDADVRLELRAERVERPAVRVELLCGRHQESESPPHGGGGLERGRTLVCKVEEIVSARSDQTNKGGLLCSLRQNRICTGAIPPETVPFASTTTCVCEPPNDGMRTRSVAGRTSNLPCIQIDGPSHSCHLRARESAELKAMGGSARTNGVLCDAVLERAVQPENLERARVDLLASV